MNRLRSPTFNYLDVLPAEVMAMAEKYNKPTIIVEKHEGDFQGETFNYHLTIINKPMITRFTISQTGIGPEKLSLIAMIDAYKNKRNETIDIEYDWALGNIVITDNGKDLGLHAGTSSTFLTDELRDKAMAIFEDIVKEL